MAEANSSFLILLSSFLADHWLDITTTILGLAYILLEYKASIWMWAVGAVMQFMGIVLYYQKGLYADCGMEFYYLAMTAYGYWKWKTLHLQGGTVKAATPITHMPPRLAVRWGTLFLLLWALIWWLLTTFTDSTVPVADAFTTALSLIGIWALAHKYLEQWFVWIAVDVVTCVLYFHKDIPFKASLYGLYVIIAIFGYRRWRRLMMMLFVLVTVQTGLKAKDTTEAACPMVKIEAVRLPDLNIPRSGHVVTPES